MRRTILAVVLAALSLGAGWGALRPEATGAAPLPASSQPVWSPDRLPALLAEVQGTVDLERAVDELLSKQSAGFRSCLAVYEGDRPVLVRRPDLALTPASTQKLFVAAAALRVLGPDFRFVTKVVAAERPRNGVVGTLWLVGAGDPSLATPEYAIHLKDRPRTQIHDVTPLAALADGLRAAGVRVVAGSVLGDDSRHDRTRAVPTWKESYITQNQVGPLGALVVNGGLTAFKPPQERAADPAVHAAAELSRLLSAVGVAVAGVPGPGVAPKDPVTLAEIRSVPLSELVSTTVRESDNLAAELLVRELGRARAGDGSTPAGTAVIASELAGLGLAVSGLRLGDGSGLEVTNTATCALLDGLLRIRHLGARDWLAVAGRSGTLATRLADTPLEGRLRAKTGSLTGVTGLAGFVDGRRNLSFAFLANGAFSDAAGRVLQDRLVTLLAGYPGPQPRL